MDQLRKKGFKRALVSIGTDSLEKLDLLLSQTHAHWNCFPSGRVLNIRVRHRVLLTFQPTLRQPPIAAMPRTKDFWATRYASTSGIIASVEIAISSP